MLVVVALKGVTMSEATEHDRSAIDRRDIDTWFAAMDRYDDVEFMPGGREQPALPAGRCW